MAKRYELSDASWEMIEDLITQDQKTGHPRNGPYRDRFGGIKKADDTLASVDRAARALRQ
jgi:transposase